jgi:hypothetical protein
MNFSRRKKEVSKINENNQRLLKAIQNVKPSVKRRDLKNHEARINKLKHHMGVVNRYSPSTNFIFPMNGEENNNYSSSSFVYVRNPSHGNILYTNMGLNFHKNHLTSSN